MVYTIPSMKTITQVYTIKASVSKVWNALIIPAEIDKWNGGPAKMTDKEGVSFSLWGGDIHGKNVKVVKEKELKQEWYGGDWDKPSIVTFTLKEAKGMTAVTLFQADVPDDEAKDIADGWDDYYLGAIKEYLERS